MMREENKKTAISEPKKLRRGSCLSFLIFHLYKYIVKNVRTEVFHLADSHNVLRVVNYGFFQLIKILY